MKVYTRWNERVYMYLFPSFPLTVRCETFGHKLWEMIPFTLLSLQITKISVTGFFESVTKIMIPFQHKCILIISTQVHMGLWTIILHGEFLTKWRRSVKNPIRITCGTNLIKYKIRHGNRNKILNVLAVIWKIWPEISHSLAY